MHLLELEKLFQIIEKVLKVSENPECKYSTVTNGLYNPEFLFSVIDRIVEKVGINKLDINFSYDLKYRFKTHKDAELVLNNINLFHKKYDYKLGVQMILTQYLINMWKEGTFEPNKFIEKNIPGNILTFLYPHPIYTGKVLTDFNFSRKDFLKFMKYLKSENYEIYYNFLQSTKNSCSFKYTGLRDRKDYNDDYKQEPVLSDGKEILNTCGHSILYKCYSDSDKCVLCDLNKLDKEAYL